MAGTSSGFGATTLGGDDQPKVHVTSFADTGAGTLRAAVSQGNRKVVFDIGGEIVLTDYPLPLTRSDVSTSRRDGRPPVAG